MNVVPLAPRAQWFGDARDGSRALRASWHVETPRLVGSLAAGLAAAAPLATAPGDVQSA